MLKKISFILILFVIILNASPKLYDSYEPESGRFWVFFKDKGDNIQQKKTEFRAGLDEKNIQRRLRLRDKNNLVTFHDLPIRVNYTQQIENQGYEIHRKNRWLNAVSVYARDFASVKMLLDFDFVDAIKPVVTYKRPLVDFSSLDIQSDMEIYFDLEYGSSLQQLEMLGMTEVHRMGFNGEGIILAMFDTGFRTSHEAFRESNIIAEHDFVEGDSLTSTPESAWGHGTSTWGAAAGKFPGELYGPGFGTDIILARTEDRAGEYIGEEDNWAAAIMWAESLGTDIVSSSLGYHDWYTPEDMNGDSCITTRAADIAASLGVLVVNANGNSGYGVTTIVAPADADSILAIGAVSSDSMVASFSSRGPTADGRIKPDLCARGMGTRCARSGSDFDLGSGNGTSLATPLISGACAALWQAHPDYSPMDIIELLKNNANNKFVPDNDYGWGIPNFSAAIRTNGDSLLLLPLYRGWNMFSNPFTDTLELSDDLFPDMFSYCWAYNAIEKEYYAIERLAPGQACFLPYYHDTIMYIEGELSDSIFTPVHPGWNMVGAAGKSSLPGEYSIIPDAARADSSVYYYDPVEKEYIQKKILITGEARWILMTDHASFFAR
ncbi:MAG: S8 family serine peptidase [Candidatus Zixiibacteriota bacterium]